MTTNSTSGRYISGRRIAAAAVITSAVIALMSWVVPAHLPPAVENDFIRTLKAKFAAAKETLPEERVYLQLDKPFYRPDETIWFSAYLRNARDFTPSSQSDILNVELINPRGSVEKIIRLVARNGKAAGDFSLGEEVPGGLYKVKAYTNWQKNDSAFFEKEITVQDVVLPALKMKLDFDRKAFGAGDEVSARIRIETNENQPLAHHKIRVVARVGGQEITEEATATDYLGEKRIRFTLPAKLKTSDGLLNVMMDYQGQTESISRSIPISLNHVRFTLFPEGGNLVRGMESRVAFRALNEHDKPSDVEGVVMNSRGKQVASFASYHNGMGAFEIAPVFGEVYYATITKPEGIAGRFELPQPLNRGYVLSVEQQNGEEIILNIGTTEDEELSLVSRMRGNICYATAVQAKPGRNSVVIPAAAFPMGVAQFTLFDSKGIERAERLAFVNRDRRLNVSITTGKEKYLPREKVKMTITVKDERGMPMPARLSLSVVNDQLLAFADDKQGNILSKMLLEYDLREKVAEPGFYFDAAEEKAEKALDYLLMTSGWRRFTWEQVLTDNLPPVTFAPEKAVPAGIELEEDAMMNPAPVFRLKMAMPAANDSREEVRAEKREAAGDRPAQENKKELAQARVLAFAGDERARRLHGRAEEQAREPANRPAALYYRAREFAAPVYPQGEFPEERTDFRSTIYWNADVAVDASGKKEISFCVSDDITSFRATAEGISRDGNIGRAEKTFFSQMPFSMTVKIPAEVVTEDVVSIPLTLKNNTTASVTGLLSIAAPEGLEPLSAVPGLQTLAAGKAKTVYLQYRVKEGISAGDFEVAFRACGVRDAFVQHLKVVPKGFPVNVSFSGDRAEAEYVVDIRHAVKGSLRAKLTAFPSVVSDLLTGVEGILREPGGCFEQTSMSSYPNAMVVDYLRTSGSRDEQLLAHAGGMLDRGYRRLVTFETSERGYEWFGQAPGHQGLTAYGLMQFNDLTKVYEGVDRAMVNRTADWILSQKDGNGGFKRNSRALHDFGRISDEVMNGYIVYALAEAGYGSRLTKEAQASFETAMKNKDPYQLAMSANALYILRDRNAGKAMNELLARQNKDGSFDGITHSITHSTGQSLRIETTSLAILAMLKSPARPLEAIRRAVESLVQNRSGHGSFGNTQGTVLALKALTEFTKANKATPEDGTLEFYVNGRKVAEQAYKAGEQEAVVIAGLERFLDEGKHRLNVRFSGTNSPLPHALAVSWNTSLPASDGECSVDITTKLAEKSVNQGETVRMEVALKNKTGEGLPSPIAIIGIPAGLSLQPWQLKELQDKQVFDYYEITGSNLVLYYRGMAPGDERRINLDLRADIPGEYEAPASTAYLYYTNEHKTWYAGEKIVVRRQG